MQRKSNCWVYNSGGAYFCRIRRIKDEGFNQIVGLRRAGIRDRARLAVGAFGRFGFGGPQFDVFGGHQVQFHIRDSENADITEYKIRSPSSEHKLFLYVHPLSISFFSAIHMSIFLTIRGAKDDVISFHNAS